MQNHNENHEDEEAIVQTLAQDADRLFLWLLERYQDKLYGFISLHLESYASPEDVAQDLWVRVYKALSRMSPQDRCALQIRAWLYECARHLIIDHRNRTTQWARHGVTLVSMEALPEEERDVIDETSTPPELVLEQAETREEVWRLLAMLPEIHRTIVVMRCLQGQKYDQIAERVGLSKEEVTALFENAMRRLRRAANHRVG